MEEAINYPEANNENNENDEIAEMEPPHDYVVGMLRGDRWLKGVLVEEIRKAIEEEDGGFMEWLMELVSVDDLLDGYSGLDYISEEDAERMSTLLSQATGISVASAGLLKINPLAACCLLADFEEIAGAVEIYASLVEAGYIEDVDLAEGPDGEKYSLPIEDLLFLRDVSLLGI